MKLSRRVVSSSRVGAPHGVVLRLLREDDVDSLGALMWNAYRGTVDDEYADPADAAADAMDTLAGKWGPLIEEASVVATVEDELIAAVITVRDANHDLMPLLAFALTDPRWQRRGIGEWLIRESLARLSAMGISEIHLAVTRGNPAQRLYERIGFDIVG